MSRKLAFTMVFLAWALGSPCLAADEKPVGAAPTEDSAVRQVTEQLVKAFNAGKADDVARFFFEGADLTDDAGVDHKGRADIQKLLAGFFEKFPGASCTMSIDSVWLVGPAVAVQEGQKTVNTKDGSSTVGSHYAFVLMKDKDEWKIASAKETEDDAGLTPHDHLKPLSWMIGEWVDESPDAAVKISCQWSEDKNFLLVEYDARIAGKRAMKSTQRIGWDPLSKKIKSWVFDTDGGHGEGTWTQVADHWVIKSTAVLPDGQTGSATIMLEPKDKDHFVTKGFDRIHGDTARKDYEITVVRKPPEPGVSNPAASR